MNELGKEARPPARPPARPRSFCINKKMWEFSTMGFLYCLSKRKNRPAATKPDDPSSPSSFPLPFLPFLCLAGTHALLALSFLLLFCYCRCAPGSRVCGGFCWSRFIGASLLTPFLCSIALAVVLLSSVDTGFNACSLRCLPLPCCCCCCCCWCRLFSSLWTLFVFNIYFFFLLVVVLFFLVVLRFFLFFRHLHPGLVLISRTVFHACGNLRV